MSIVLIVLAFAFVIAAVTSSSGHYDEPNGWRTTMLGLAAVACIVIAGVMR